MLYDKLTKEQVNLTKKVMDDCESVELSLYHLVRFMADIKSDPDSITRINEAIKIVQSAKQSLSWKVQRNNE